MKSFQLFIVIIFFSINSVSQEYDDLYYQPQEQIKELGNFKIDNGQIIWQQIYETNLTYKDLLRVIKESGIYESLETSDSTIIGDLRQFNADYQGAGYREMAVPMYIPRSYVKGYLVVEYKQGRYRATLKKIVLIQKYDDPLTEQGEITVLEFFGLNNSKSNFTNSFSKIPNKIYEYTFDKLFTFTLKPDSDNW